MKVIDKVLEGLNDEYRDKIESMVVELSCPGVFEIEMDKRLHINCITGDCRKCWESELEVDKN